LKVVEGEDIDRSCVQRIALAISLILGENKDGRIATRCGGSDVAKKFAAVEYRPAIKKDKRFGVLVIGALVSFTFLFAVSKACGLPYKDRLSDMATNRDRGRS
jgi:hypothetical protein